MLQVWMMATGAMVTRVPAQFLQDLKRHPGLETALEPEAWNALTVQTEASLPRRDIGGHCHAACTHGPSSCFVAPG